MLQRRSMRIHERTKERFNDDDRISLLPNDLIHHIYSFLDSKFSVQSSLLSRRWRNTWKSDPRLKLEADSGHKFDNFVQKFLSSREKDADISTIDFRSNSITIRLLKKIIAYSMSHRTKKLNIELEHLSRIPVRGGVFDLSLFKSHFLQDLRLVVDFEFFKIPNLTWDLPTLTTSHLEGVTFTLYPPNDDKSLDLFSTILNLKNLVLVNCGLWEIHTFYITSSRLENLTLKCRKHACQFVISTPNLSSFIYEHMHPSLLLASDLDSLETVNFRIIYDRYTENLVYYVEMMINTFHQLRKAKHLTLDRNAVLYLSRFCGLPERRPCPFIRLESVTFDQMPCCIFRNHLNFDDILSYFRSSSPSCVAYIEYMVGHGLQ